MNLKKLKTALWNKDGFWAIVGILATVMVGLDTLALMLTGNPAWYGAFLFVMFVIAWTTEGISEIIERYKETK